MIPAPSFHHHSVQSTSSAHPVASLPTKEQAEKTLWGLGDRFWMQMIDAQYHEWGPMVFDKGLHNGIKEPGFYASLKAGFEYASAHLKDKLTVDFYLSLHKNLCGHFKGKENNTEMNANQAGTFRVLSTSCNPSLKNFKESREHYLYIAAYDPSVSEDPVLSDLEKDQEYQDVKELERQKFRSFIQWRDPKISRWYDELKIKPNIRQLVETQYPISKKWVEEWEQQWKTKVEALNAYVSEYCESMGFDKFISFKLVDNNLLVVDYHAIGPDKIRQVVERLFENYNHQIEEINQNIPKASSEEVMQLQEKKIEAISLLFQWLDWLHPFPDGQGRTDLVLMAKLLSEEGANPAILDDPYFSTYSLPHEWKAQLLEGMKRWQAERDTV